LFVVVVVVNADNDDDRLTTKRTSTGAVRWRSLLQTAGEVVS
jgi:hypothetical protein